MSVGEDPRSGRPSTSTNDNHVERVHAVIRANGRLTVREVADKVGISIGSCQQIFTEELQMRCVSAEFMPRLLIDNQKENCVEISNELLAIANGNENFLEMIIFVFIIESKVDTLLHIPQTVFTPLGLQIQHIPQLFHSLTLLMF
jgi:hypothetical protein